MYSRHYVEVNTKIRAPFALTPRSLCRPHK